MKKYRKKPVVIEAVQIHTTNISLVEEWCGGQIKGTQLPLPERVIDIQTLEGEMRAEMYDWIIKGVEGEFYPCKPGIFDKTYEEVELTETPLHKAAKNYDPEKEVETDA